MPEETALRADHARLTAPPLQGPLAHTKANTGVSGLEQIHNPWFRTPLTILNALGETLAPRLVTALPGTPAHHERLVRLNEARQEQLSKQATEEAGREHANAETAAEQARANEQEAQAEKLRNLKGQLIFDKAGNAIGYQDEKGAMFGPEDENLPAGVRDVLAAAKPKPVKGGTLLEWYRDVHPNSTPEDFKKFEAEAAAANRPETAEQNKLNFQNTIAKLAAEAPLPPDALMDVKKLGAHIAGSQSLTADQKNKALAYLAANTTPAAQGTSAQIRVEGMGQTREYPVINKQTGQLEMRSAADINASKGSYAPAGPGAAAMGKEAVFQDLHYNIDAARKAIQALDSMDAGTRAALSYALRHTDPASAFQTFLTGSAATAINPQQQEAVQALALLAENAMSLRSVAGMGQGSDELRSAILNTIPSGKSPTKGYALGQLDKFEQVVKRLESGVPGVRSTGGAAGGTIHYTDGGKDYDIPAEKEAAFLRAHPKATKGQ